MHSPDSEGTYSAARYLRKVKNPEAHLKKLAVYHAMADIGPDVSFGRIGSIMPRARKAMKGKSMIKGYETGTLHKALRKIGMRGPKSDQLRHESDRYF